jgi:cell division transport system permease protein
LSSNSDNIASIKNIKNIKSIDFVDKNRALKSFVAENKDLKEQLDMLEENPLKNHFVIKLKDNRYKVIKQFVDSLSSLNFIDDVVYSEDLVKNVDNFFKYMVRIGIILFTFFLGIIIWILNYTIKIDLHYKKLEFLLWRYLGAESYIENFLIFGEALILGIIAGIISIGLLFLFYWFISMFLFNIEFLSPVSIVTIFIFGIILSGAINFVVYKKSKNEIF